MYSSFYKIISRYHNFEELLSREIDRNTFELLVKEKFISLIEFLVEKTNYPFTSSEIDITYRNKNLFFFKYLIEKTSELPSEEVIAEILISNDKIEYLNSISNRIIIKEEYEEIMFNYESFFQSFSLLPKTKNIILRFLNEKKENLRKFLNESNILSEKITVFIREFLFDDKVIEFIELLADDIFSSILRETERMIYENRSLLLIKYLIMRRNILPCEEYQKKILIEISDRELLNYVKDKDIFSSSDLIFACKKDKKDFITFYLYHFDINKECYIEILNQGYFSLLDSVKDIFIHSLEVKDLLKIKNYSSIEYLFMEKGIKLFYNEKYKLLDLSLVYNNKELFRFLIEKKFIFSLAGLFYLFYKKEEGFYDIVKELISEKHSFFLKLFSCILGDLKYIEENLNKEKDNEIKLYLFSACYSNNKDLILYLYERLKKKKNKKFRKEFSYHLLINNHIDIFKQLYEKEKIYFLSKPFLIYDGKKKYKKKEINEIILFTILNKDIDTLEKIIKNGNYFFSPTYAFWNKKYKKMKKEIFFPFYLISK
ncbi:MAG: hypothetical protein QXG00_05925 [Candidatus Woesearchaeota archaeon]